MNERKDGRRALLRGIHADPRTISEDNAAERNERRRLREQRNAKTGTSLTEARKWNAQKQRAPLRLERKQRRLEQPKCKPKRKPKRRPKLEQPKRKLSKQEKRNRQIRDRQIRDRLIYEGLIRKSE